MSAAVSHELRNPLTSLIGQIETMKIFFKGFQDLIDNFKITDEKIDNKMLV